MLHKMIMGKVKFYMPTIEFYQKRKRRQKGNGYNMSREISPGPITNGGNCI